MLAGVHVGPCTFRSFAFPFKNKNKKHFKKFFVFPFENKNWKLKKDKFFIFPFENKIKEK